MRTRFAPSPTGNLHIGGARTAIFNWLAAKSSFILRIEDTDTSRNTEAFEQVIYNELSWLGLNWNEGPIIGGQYAPYKQSERSSIYQTYINQLLSSKQAYHCACPPGTDDQSGGCINNCQTKTIDANNPVRFKVPQIGTTIINDLIKGTISFNNKDIEDFILIRSNGIPTYNFAAVVDDHSMNITHVLRGDEHLTNTPKQILLYQALNLSSPAFGHIPLILGPDGKKLSKRHGATSVAQYREMGILPEALTNYLTRLGWAHGNMEFFSIEESKAVFNISNIGTAPAKWDIKKLLWLNAQWIKHLPESIIADRLKPFLILKGLNPEVRDLIQVVSILKERSNTLLQMADQAAFLFQPDEPNGNHPYLPDLLPILTALTDWSDSTLNKTIHEFCSNQNIKIGDLAHSLRMALCQKPVGPPIIPMLLILGKDSSLKRLSIAS